MKWCKGTLSPRSGYYAGRGPRSGDLGDTHLEMLWTGIRDDVGEEAARNFVLMVEALDDISATAFLVSFEHYFCNKFRWLNRQQTRQDGITLSGRGEQLRAEATFLIFEALGGSRSSPEDDKRQSYYIKEPFLRRHGVKQKPPTGKVNNMGFTCYDDGWSGFPPKH